MIEYTNSATRILHWIEEMGRKNANLSSAECWSETFGITWNKSSPDAHEIQIHLNALREEVDSLERQMRETDFSESLYLGYLHNVRRVVSAPNLDAPYNSYKPLVGPDTMIVLRWCAEAIEPEPTISAEDLSSILEKINELRLEIDSLGLSLSVRNFILRQLDIIEKAIQNYPIKGGAAVRKGLNEVWTEFANSKSAPTTEDEVKKASKFNTIISMIGTAADAVIKGDAVAQAVVSIANHGHTAVQALSIAMNQNPQIGTTI